MQLGRESIASNLYAGVQQRILFPIYSSKSSRWRVRSLVVHCTVFNTVNTINMY